MRCIVGFHLLFPSGVVVLSSAVHVGVGLTAAGFFLGGGGDPPPLRILRPPPWIFQKKSFIVQSVIDKQQHNSNRTSIYLWKFHSLFSY